MNGHSHHDHGHDAHHADGHGHGHGHGHGGEQASERRLWLAFGLLFCFTLVEAGGGMWANSVALYAEAAHMLADSASLLLAMVAIRMAQRPARADRTYGHRRYQTLAAYTNGLVLLVLTVVVVIAAARRLLLPPHVNGTVMLITAAVGAAANICAFLALSGATSLNERSARLHVLSDLAGSAAAIGRLGPDPVAWLGHRRSAAVTGGFGADSAFRLAAHAHCRTCAAGGCTARTSTPRPSNTNSAP